MGFYVQGTIIKLEFYAEMLKKRNSQNPVVQSSSCAILCCVLCTCSHLPHGLPFFLPINWSPARGIFQTQQVGVGNIDSNKAMERDGFLCNVCILYVCFIMGYLFYMRKLPIIYFADPLMQVD